MIEIKDLRMGSPAPNFRLKSHRGQMVELRSYRHRQPLILFFMHDPACNLCGSYLKALIGEYPNCQLEQVEIIVILPMGQVQAAIDTHKPPFHILADPDNTVRTAYLGDALSGIVVLDRYNGQQVCEVGHTFMKPAEALSWAVFSESTCPECGVLEWTSD